MSRPWIPVAVALIGVGVLFGRSEASAAPIATAPVPADSERQAVARAYLHALLTHDPSPVRFTPTATRVEAGLKTGFSGPQMTADLSGGVQYRIVQGIRELTFAESGPTVTATYLLDAGIGSARLVTVAITERFDIPVDAIDTIDARIRPVSVG